MKISPEKMQKAKKILKKCNFWQIVLVFGVILAYSVMCYFSYSFIEILLSVVFICYVTHVCSLKIFNKFIGSVLTNKFDPDTYLALIYQGKVDSPAAIRQIPGEYFCGNYQNVISICNTKLADPKMAKRYKYYYLTYLANTYFDIGDDENLRLTCDRYREALSAEKPSKQEKIRKNYIRMDLFETYLNRDIDTCIKMISTPAPMEIDQHRRTFYRAKFAILQGKEEMAREYCDHLVEAIPNLTYGKLADKALERMDSGETSFDAFAFFETVEVEVDIAGETFYPLSKRLLIGVVAALIMIVLYAIIFGVLTCVDFMGAGAEYEEEQAKEQAAYAEYVESIRLLVEEDYDGVRVLDTFTLKAGEYVVDTMFICRTDTHFVVGCIYTNKGESTPRYKTQVAVPIEDLSQYYYIQYFSFSAVTSDYQISSCFYTDLSNVPSDSHYSFTCVENGHVVGYIVTDIKPIP